MFTARTERPSVRLKPVRQSGSIRRYPPEDPRPDTTPVDSSYANCRRGGYLVSVHVRRGGYLVLAVAVGSSAISCTYSSERSRPYGKVG